MEILNTTHHYIEFWFWIVIVGLFTLVFLLLMFVGWFSVISDKQLSMENVVPSLIVTAISILGVVCFTIQINDGVRVSHDVKVSDWNDVFDQEYKVVKQKGEIVTVEKKQ